MAWQTIQNFAILALILSIIQAVVDWLKEKHNHEKRKKHRLLLTIAGFILSLIGIFLSEAGPEFFPAENSSTHSSELSTEANTTSTEQVTAPTEATIPPEATTSTEAPTTNLEQSYTVDEQHSPNDAATYVTIDEWDPVTDLDITMRRFGGGLKVAVCDMFSYLGSTLENEVTSRLIITLPYNHNETTFNRNIVLDQSMYGSKSHGVIRILVDNNEVFSTGDISGDCTESFPFSINIENADSIVVEASVTLIASNFVYGFVDDRN